ncbi:hypothetical protein ASG94_20275 [Nocardioides sp. Soil805]|nr:hypothetical protein ASG94_20275 [Nocardioides sp. Soil805]
METPGDAELISAVRGGDTDAYGQLFERHVEAARRLARQLVSAGDVEDLVSEAFVKVLQVLQRGGGPDVAFRAYLLTAVRRLRVDRLRATSRLHTTDDMEMFDPGVPFRDTAVEGFESATAARAFASLPERWQLVLWHTEVEGQKPADVAPLLGMSANSVSALAYRAREGLRQAYLNEHASELDDESCQWTRAHLGAYIRNGISRRDAGKLEDHLGHCRSCAAIYLELSEVNSNLGAILAPLLLGGVGAAYASAATGAAAPAGLAGLVGRARDLIGAHSQVAAVVGVTAAVSVGGGGFLVWQDTQPPAAVSGAVAGTDQTDGEAALDDAASAAAGSGALSGGRGQAQGRTAGTTAGTSATPGPTSPVPSSPASGPASGPASEPGDVPSTETTDGTSDGPTDSPTDAPTEPPSDDPTQGPTDDPTQGPTTQGPTQGPTDGPTQGPTAPPTTPPTSAPTSAPTAAPTVAPTGVPTTLPTLTPPPVPLPTVDPPTTAPTTAPTTPPTTDPTTPPTTDPTTPPTTPPTTDPTTPPTTDPTTPPTSPPTTDPTPDPDPDPAVRDLVMSVTQPTGNGASVDLTATVVGLPEGETATLVLTGDPVLVQVEGAQCGSWAGGRMTCTVTDSSPLAVHAVSGANRTSRLTFTATSDDGPDTTPEDNTATVTWD